MTKFILFRAILTSLLFSAASISAYAAPTAQFAETSQRLIQMLDYMGVDYPPTVENGKVIDEVEYTEMQEFSGEVVNLLAQMPAHESKSSLINSAEQLRSSINNKVPGEQVALATQQLKITLIDNYKITVAPAQLPDMANARTLFESACVSCHGAQGMGDGPLAAGMQPEPSNFHDMGRQYSRSVFDLYNTITLGVSGTPMPNFKHLSDEDRWALAMMVSRYSASDAQRTTGKLLWQQGVLHNDIQTLTNLMGMSYARAEELGKHEGVDGQAILAYLRSNPAVLEVSDHAALDKSIAMLATSLTLAKEGDRKGAHKAALSAYLDGFELAEASLVVVDNKLKQSIEMEMMTFRELTKTGSTENLELQQSKLVDLLDQAKQTLGSTAMSPAAAFTGAFIILLREGVEAVLVLAAIMAVVIKTGRREAMVYIHAGWIGAILLGIATWWVAGNLIAISGASREVTEGIAALFAAAILVYVGFWLHNASNSKRWKQYVEHKIDNAMSSSTLWILASVSFIAVYREMFETVLFYQSMWLQLDSGSEQSFIYGILAAIALLIVISVLIFRAGTRLPIKLFFQINAILLFLLAVVFSGQGIAALQEAGMVAISTVNFPRVDILGVHPTMQSLGLQFVVLMLGVVLLTWQRKLAK